MTKELMIPKEVSPGLFLSGIAGLDSLDALGITHVLVSFISD